MNEVEEQKWWIFTFGCGHRFAGCYVKIYGTSGIRIYKIQFKNPDEQTRKQILQSLIPGLSDTDATSLAAGFPSFSGGNIENVARKSTVNYVLTGTRPDLAALTDFCRGEQISQSGSRNRVGYCNIPRA